jgi:hypothetical protein
VSTIADVSRGLNNVRTAGQAKIAIGEALSEIGRSYRSEPRITAENARVLDRVRLPLESWIRELQAVADSTDYRDKFQGRRDTITRAYVETYGILGEVNARQSVSFVAELGAGFQALPGQIGRAVGAVAAGAGEAAGGLVGGLLSGLGPVLVIVLVLVAWSVLKGRRT